MGIRFSTYLVLMFLRIQGRNWILAKYYGEKTHRTSSLFSLSNIYKLMRFTECHQCFLTY